MLDSAADQGTSPTSPPDLPDSTNPSPPPIDIALINAVAFRWAIKEPRAVQLSLQLRATATSSRAADTKIPTPEELQKFNVPDEYHDFADVFSEGLADELPPHRPYDLKIDLKDGKTPPFSRVYQLSPSKTDALQRFLDDNLKNGFIRPSRSPAGAPIFFVKKKSGALRLCVDYHGLNTSLARIPLISDLLNAPVKAPYYTKLDLKHAYHLIHIADGDEWKTAFRTKWGSYEFLMVPFGLCNAPSVWQQFINEVLADLIDVCIVVYLDDILIYSDNLSDHCKHVHDVLRRLHKHCLFCRTEKCKFHIQTVEYLGFILSPSGLTMDEKKVRTITEWLTPRKVKDIQSFLGFCNFYRWFIDNYSHIVVLLTRLTHKNTPWVFSEDCQKSFNTLKTAFHLAPILSHYIPGQPLIVKTNTSDYALAAILSTIAPDGEMHPIAFHSRTFVGAELNYDMHDKELLTIFDAFHQWRHYLEGSEIPIQVITDHKNLEYFTTTKILTHRQY